MVQRENQQRTPAGIAFQIPQSIRQIAADSVKFIPMAAITNITWKTVVRPMRTTFATSLGSKTCATSVIVSAKCSDGSVGVGEVPTSFVLPHETVKAIQTILAEAKVLLLGKPVGGYTALTARLQKQYPNFHMTISGLEVALFRAWLASQGICEVAFWNKIKHAHASPSTGSGQAVGMAPNNRSKIIETDITIPFVLKPEIIEPWIRRAIRNGFCTYKVKVSGDVKKDLKFCKAIHKILGGTAKRLVASKRSEDEQLDRGRNPFIIRLDGNQGFTAKSAMELLEKLDRIAIGVELFEQPLKCDDYKGMKILFKQSPVPIIADETVFCAEDCKRVIDDHLAHGVNIKIAKSGISESRRILKLAKQAGLKLMIGCMTETIVGLSAGIYLAAGTGAFDYIDLDSIHFLRHHNRYGNIVIDGRFYHIGKQP
jgi:L-Ala-D/L-Glu epimerase